MARSFRLVTPQTELPEFANGTFSHDASRQEFAALRRDGKYYVRRHQGTNIVEKEVHYVFGSGNHARSYLHRTAPGRLIEFPITWYTQNGGSWAMSPAFDRPDHPGFTREISYECMSCHNAYPAVDVEKAWPGNSGVFPDQLPQGIDCQRCHGPGAKHAETAARKDIVNPARLTRERQLEICMQCHLETTSLRLPAAVPRLGRSVFSYRPGEPLESHILHFSDDSNGEKFDFVSAVYRLRKSACFQSGAMTCNTCHDPHKAMRGAEAVQHYKQACSKCHQGVKSGQHPAGDDCASCHMPRRRPLDVIHVSTTDHFIQARPAPVPQGPLVEHHDGNTLPYRGEVKLYYPPKIAPSPEAELALAVAQVKHGSNADKGIPRLEQAIGRHVPQRSEPYFELAEALRKQGQLERAITAYGQALKRAPARWVHHYGYALALIASMRPERAAEALTQAIAMQPGEPQLFYALGEAYAFQGRNADAMQAFRKALGLNSDMAEVHNNLATALLKEGDRTGAEKAWREAIRIRPDLSRARLNLVNLLMSGGRLAECEAHLSEAIRVDTALVSAAGMRDSAPQMHVQLARAHLSMGIVLTKTNRPGEARGHLMKAASSTEPEIRQLADQILRQR